MHASKRVKKCLKIKQTNTKLVNKLQFLKTMWNTGTDATQNEKRILDRRIMHLNPSIKVQFNVQINAAQQGKKHIRYVCAHIAVYKILSCGAFYTYHVFI